ncbi:MAG TPA: V4R domain-containing protein [Polyangiaceae bacterium LLY-WYZ-14_1]|jgi:predicted hydrocarbon binding protein|nr:V4R domain-containing protein [Polyangiaceae bacterium LLY-WYZ-14_1]
MSATPGQPTIKVNYFHHKDFFKYDQDSGVILTRNAQRAFHVSEDFIVGLQTGLEQEVGDASAVVMYKCGYQWGLADMKVFEATMYRDFSRDVRDMNIQFVMEEWWWPLQAMGWGSWEIDFNTKRDQGLVIINLYDSAVARSLGEVGKPVCYVYAGLFAGALTHLARRSLSGIEIQCYAMGSTYCRFLIGSEKRINAVEFWLEEGATASDVISRL